MKVFEGKLTNAAIFISLFGVFGTGLSYLLRIILARNLTLEEYGLFYAVFSFVSLFLFFESFGTATALVKFTSQFKSEGDYSKVKTAIFSTFLIQVISFGLISILLYFLAPFLSEKYFRNSAAETLIKLFVIYILLSMVFKIFRSILNGFKKFRSYALMEPTRLLIVIISLLIFLKFEFGLLSPILAFITGWFIASLIFSFSVLKSFDFKKYKIHLPLEMGKKLLLFGIPLMFVGISSKVISNFDTLVLTYFMGLDQVGIYNVILPSSLIFLFLGSSISTILLPVSSELWAHGLTKRISDRLNSAYKYILLLTLPLVMATMVYSEFFLKLFFGEDFVPGATAFKILLFGVAFYSIAVINNSVLSGMGKPKVVMKILIFVSFFKI